MNISPLQRHLKSDGLPLDKVVSNPNMPETEKVNAASKAFEAILVKQIIQNAQKPMFASKLVPQSSANGIYQDMVAEQLANSISQSGALGLGRSINQQLQHALPSSARAHSAASQTTVNEPKPATVSEALRAKF